jgi:hypothetical protein
LIASEWIRISGAFNHVVALEGACAIPPPKQIRDR